PVGAAVVGDVGAAIAGDHHVPPVAGVDPQGVAVGMHAPAQVGREGDTAVIGAVLLHAQDVDPAGIGTIDPGLAEVHRPGVEAVHSVPGLPAVGRAIDAAVQVPLGALLVLDVLVLPGQGGQVGTGARRAPASAAEAGPLGERDGDFLLVLAAHNGQ